jgi:hypothetical protein
VSTYAYVNPVVAVFLGWLILSEPLTPRTLVAATIIVGAVALITRGAGKEKSGADVPERDRRARRGEAARQIVNEKRGARTPRSAA